MKYVLYAVLALFTLILVLLSPMWICLVPTYSPATEEEAIKIAYIEAERVITTHIKGKVDFEQLPPPTVRRNNKLSLWGVDFNDRKQGVSIYVAVMFNRCVDVSYNLHEHMQLYGERPPAYNNPKIKQANNSAL